MAQRYEPRCPKCGRLGSHLTCPACRRRPADVAAVVACVAAGVSVVHGKRRARKRRCAVCGAPSRSGECRTCQSLLARLRRIHGE